jgi:hypothetical protein
MTEVETKKDASKINKRQLEILKSVLQTTALGSCAPRMCAWERADTETTYNLCLILKIML